MKFPQITLNKTMIDVQWAFISVAVSSLVHFILRIVLGRDLGPDGLGVYTLAFTIYLFGMQFAAFGIGSALTKYVAEFIDDKTTVRNYVSSGMTSSIITGTLMGVVLFLLAPFIAVSFFHVPELEPLIRLTALCYPFIAIQKAVLGTLNGFRKMHIYAFLNIIQNVTVVVLSIVLVLVFKIGVFGAVIGFVVPTILVSTLCPVLISDWIRWDTTSLWHIPALSATTVFGFYVVLGNAIGYLNTQIDSILIGYYLNPTEVGIYAVAILIAQTLTLLPSAIQCVTTPKMAALYGRGEIGEIRRLFYTTLKQSLFITAGCLILIALCSPFIITFIFGQQYQACYIPLLILLIGYGMNAAYSAVGSTLSCIGQVQRVSHICAVFVILNIILNIILIPIYGIIGAAMATTISMVISLPINMMITKYYLDRSSLKSSH